MSAGLLSAGLFLCLEGVKSTDTVQLGADGAGAPLSGRWSVSARELLMPQEVTGSGPLPEDWAGTSIHPLDPHCLAG